MPVRFVASPHALLDYVAVDEDLAIGTAQLSADSAWVLDEHRAEVGRAVLPGTAHLELYAEMASHLFAEPCGGEGPHLRVAVGGARRGRARCPCGRATCRGRSGRRRRRVEGHARIRGARVDATDGRSTARRRSCVPPTAETTIDLVRGRRTLPSV